jgi:GNAT superfamily N-acetyltransferase
MPAAFPDRTRRILVVANETVESPVLQDALRAARADEADTQVLVVAPALNSRLRHWLSDEDAARGAAAEQLRRAVEQLRRAGFDAHGWIGDADPLQATVDALHLFAADRVVVSTHPEHRSNWLARNLVERIRLRCGRPVLHVVADTTSHIAGREELAAA